MTVLRQDDIDAETYRMRAKKLALTKGQRSKTSRILKATTEKQARCQGVSETCRPDRNKIIYSKF